MMTKDNDRTRLDLVRGSLVGGAAGDALGYPVEFMQYGEIVRRFGPKGIISYVLDKGVARISDDTQMTLFTANGMLLGLTRGFMKGVGNAPEFYVEYAYQDWLTRLPTPVATRGSATCLSSTPAALQATPVCRPSAR